MKVEFFGMNWAAAQNLWILPIVAVLVALVIWRVFRLFKVRSLLTAKRWHKYILPHFSRWREIVKAVLLVVGIVALFFALLRPVASKEEKNMPQEGRDLLVALDISRSMLATDSGPDRLSFAKSKIRKLLSLLSCERVGLILFSGSALMQCPLTIDYSAFYMFLDQVDVETISSGTTAIDQAIKKAVDSFSDSPNRKTKLLAVFTDGEDFSSNLSGIKQKAHQVGLNIFTVGVGTLEGAPIPRYDIEGKKTGHQRDKRDKVVISRLNEGILETLATDSGGRYIQATDDDSDLQRLVASISKFEKDKLEDKKVELFEEYYFYFLIVTFVCLALGWII